MQALAYLIDFFDNGYYIRPGSNHGGGASNGELRRWLEEGAIRINNETPKPNDEITFPIDDLVLFPGRPRQVTLL